MHCYKIFSNFHTNLYNTWKTSFRFRILDLVWFDPRLLTLPPASPGHHSGLGMSTLAALAPLSRVDLEKMSAWARGQVGQLAGKSAV